MNYPQGPQTDISEREAAAYLKVSVRGLIDWRNRGLLPYFRISRSIRYSRQQIDRALESQHQRNLGGVRIRFAALELNIAFHLDRGWISETL